MVTRQRGGYYPGDGEKSVPTLVYTWWFFLEEKWKVSDRVIPRWKERNTKDDTTSPSVWFFSGFLRVEFENVVSRDVTCPWGQMLCVVS